MLFIVTGGIQTKKTRQLCTLVKTLNTRQCACYGLLTPGIWLDKRTGKRCKKLLPAIETGFLEKTAIEAVLLPQGQTFSFAQKGKLSKAAFDKMKKEAPKDRRGWDISEEALLRVNQHFDTLQRQTSSMQGTKKQGVLIIDELGQLELKHGKGLLSAVTLLERGQTPLYEHAFVVVRQSLVPQALALLTGAWREHCIIGPKDVPNSL